MNFRNNHMWVGENQHEVCEDHFYHQFSLAVWVESVGDYLI